MRQHWLARALKFVAFAALALSALGFVTMSLWNALVPTLFAGPAVSFWQALGLLVLSRILLGGFRGHGGRFAHWRRHTNERWAQMTPEERAELRERLGRRCGRGVMESEPNR